MFPITVYADSACSGNPGPGGWAAELTFAPENVRSVVGNAAATTNNVMEIEAVIGALRHIEHHAPRPDCDPEKIPFDPQDVVFILDSEYVVKGLTEWMPGWKRRGCRNSDNKPIANRDQWQTLNALTETLRGAGFRLSFNWTKRHADDAGNNRVDALAVEQHDLAAADQQPQAQDAVARPTPACDLPPTPPARTADLAQRSVDYLSDAMIRAHFDGDFLVRPNMDQARIVAHLLGSSAHTICDQVEIAFRKKLAAGAR